MTSFFIDTDGYLFGCGKNTDGQLGLGTNDIKNTNIFRQISDIKFKYVSCSGEHTVAIDENGCLWSCGYNEQGQLGLKDNINRNTLEKVPVSTKFMMVNCSFWYTIAIDENGYLWACGDNSGGVLGFRDNQNRNEFERLPTDSQFKAISCTYSLMFAIDKDGFLWGCGKLENDIRKFSPILIDEQFIMVICGSFQTLLLDHRGFLWSFGLDEKHEFQKIMTDKQFKIISCASDHAIAIDEYGHLFQWDIGSKKIANKLGEKFIMCSSMHYDGFDEKTLSYCDVEFTILVDEDRLLWSCGSNRFGQLGSGNYEDNPQLAKVENTNEVKFLMNNQIIRQRGSNTKGSHNLQINID